MEFTKIQGTGNDFIFIDNRKYFLTKEKISILAKHICKRKYSIGADGLIAIEDSYSNADVKMNFFNSDGSMAEMCGNGARCIARYVYEDRLLESLGENKLEEVIIESTSGIVPAWRVDERKYKIRLNEPTLIDLDNTINIDGNEIKYSYVELGNPGLPHVAINHKNLNNIEKYDILDLARKIRGDKRFIKGSNVSFYDIIDDNIEHNINNTSYEPGDVIIKTYERGVENFTLACGTAAGAIAAVISLKNELPQKSINLISEGGKLSVEIDKSDENNIENIYLIGDTNIVASGLILDEDLFDIFDNK